MKEFPGKSSSPAYIRKSGVPEWDEQKKTAILTDSRCRLIDELQKLISYIRITGVMSRCVRAKKRATIHHGRLALRNIDLCFIILTHI